MLARLLCTYHIELPVCTQTKSDNHKESTFQLIILKINLFKSSLQTKFQNQLSQIRLLTQIYVLYLRETVIMRLMTMSTTVAVANIVAVTVKNDAVLIIVILFALRVM